jgi:hypothetical protein
LERSLLSLDVDPGEAVHPKKHHGLRAESPWTRTPNASPKVHHVITNKNSEQSQFRQEMFRIDLTGHMPKIPLVSAPPRRTF